VTNSKPSTGETVRLMLGVVISMVGIRAAMRLGSWLFDAPIRDSVSIFGFGAAVYMFFQSYANRRSRDGQASPAFFSPIAFITAILVTIGLCALAKVFPILES
jgi:hypothetical protein